jgi:hypothetical protein
MMFDDHPVVSDVRSHLLRFDAVLYTFLQQMVMPVFSEQVSTAAVTFSGDGQDRCIAFQFNPALWKRLNYSERCFLFTHEVMHVLFRHDSRGKIFLDSLPSDQRSFDLLNRAQDVAINELVHEQYFHGVPLSAMPFIAGGCFIDTLFKPEDVSKIARGRDFEYYYRTYIELYGLSGVDQLPQLLDEHASGLAGGAGEVSSVDVPDWLDESLIEASLDQYANDLMEQENPVDTGGGYSLGALSGLGSTRSVDVKKGKSLDELFRIAIRTAFSQKRSTHVHYNWHGFCRRTSMALSQMSPDLMLPVRKTRQRDVPEKHRVCVYLDLSGSCASYSKRFMTLVGNLPEDKYDVHLSVFADRVAPVTFDSRGKARYRSVGYGTNILQVIGDFKKRTGKGEQYDAVFVLTDGYYSNIKSNYEHDYSRWHFFMTPSSNHNIPKKAGMFRISEL